MDYQGIAKLADKVRQNVSKVIIGKEEQFDLIFAAMIAGGHVLLEDVPGTGKTVMARSIAASLRCSFSRLQFTPDLLPADITGMSVFKPSDGTFQFLERPFLVIATQNPVETQGTFPLPEAQLDRFLIKLSMGYPNEKEALRIMERFIRSSPLQDLQPVAEREEIVAAQDTFSQCGVSEPVMGYIAALCEATRDKDRALLGVSPRGMLALLRVSQAYAAIQGRDYVIPDDVKKLAVPVMAHRVILRGLYGKTGENEAFIRELLDKIPAPTETAK